MSRPPDPLDPTVSPAGLPASGAPPGTSSSHHGRYLPGVVLVGRYRIIDRVGRGGMGDVYRADDLKLDQAVALKFLPEIVEHDPDRLARLIAEVRLARQVSHPNLCRVYDIDEADGRHFLTMEYVDGEDLESLLRRIGHLPREKGLEIARGLCAGLAAAHDQRILHRDLKPANVMIDGRGRARITDFGLAIPDDLASGREIFAGTPAYMAPEQWAGREVTVRSDLYALGLVLYEMFTGRRAFESASARELAVQHAEVTPRAPSTLVDGFDPVIERAILRCLEKDPAARPSSALAVAASLPGGDPLAAALAAGETPSPELVAASGGEGTLRRGPALALLGACLALLGAILAIAPYSTDLGLAPPPRSPVLLADQAQRILAVVGEPQRPGDSAFEMIRDYPPLLYASKLDPSPTWRAHFRNWGTPILFRYRQSPRALVPQNGLGVIQPDDPPLNVSGMASIALTGAGRLRNLVVVPPEVDSTWTPLAARTADSTWNRLFAEAGLDRAEFADTTPIWTPLTASDERREWVGAAPWDARVPLRVSGASWQGRPVGFTVRGPWNPPIGREGAPQAATTRITTIVNGLMIALSFAFAAWMAWRNLRNGRGDRRGALRFGLFVAVVAVVRWTFTVHHVPELLPELRLIAAAVGQAAAGSMVYGLVYLAFEPHARRILPECLVGWARAIDGQWRDPRIGRDVLVGSAFGMLVAFTFHVTNGIPTWFRFAGQTTVGMDSDALAGGGRLVSFLLGQLVESIGPTITLFGLFVLARLLLRRMWLAVIVLTILILLNGLGAENFWLELPGQVFISLAWAYILVRHGLLASIAFFAMFQVVLGMPLVLAPDSPTNSATWIVLGLLVALVVAAYRIARGSAPGPAPFSSRSG